MLVGWGFVCMEPKRPVPQNATGGKPLLVGLPPSTRTAAPFGTKRSAQAPYSWGLGASTQRQRHWPPALPPPCSWGGCASAWSQSTPSPKTPQAASPCSWACCRQLPPPPHSERKEAPKPPARGAWVREHGANGTGGPHCGSLLMGLGCVNPVPTALAAGPAAPMLVGWVCVCMEPQRPVPQNAAGGRPLLVGLPPSTSAIAPTETKRRAPAPCSWGGRSSARRQRHWPPALPAYSDT